jgi:hypothetical protein
MEPIKDFHRLERVEPNESGVVGCTHDEAALGTVVMALARALGPGSERRFNVADEHDAGVRMR